MKKILLILLLIVFASLLLAEQIDFDNIMPKKLIYSELSDDYPRELNELFQFNYDEAQAILSKLENLKKNNTEKFAKKLYDYMYDRIDNMDEEKKFRIIYLDWLASNTIPLYYAEFKALHFNIEFIGSIPESKFNTISYMPSEVIELWKNHHNIPWIGNIRGRIWHDIWDRYPEKHIDFLYWNNWIWAKGIIQESECFERKSLGDKVDNKKSYIKFKITNTIGNKFTENEIIIQARSGGDVNDYYVLPIMCSYHDHYFEDEIVFLNKVYHNNPIIYRAVIGDSRKLKNNKMTKRRKSVFAEPPPYGDFPFTQDETEISYTTFKERIEDVISFIKQKAGMDQ